MGEGYGRSSFCSLCTSENSLSKLDFQVLNNGIVGTVMIHKLFCFVFLKKKEKPSNFVLGYSQSPML